MPPLVPTTRTSSTIEDGDLKHLPQLKDDISSLYLNPEYSDVTLIIEGEELHAHKNILACRSKYFKALFSSGLKETNSKEIPLEDTPNEAFKLLLKYIYTGLINLNNLNEYLLCDVLILSDRYFIDELQNSISDFLKKNLTIDNVLNILNIVHHYSMDELVKHCFLFSDKNSSKLIKQEFFLHLSKPALVDLLKRDTFFAPEEEISRATVNWCIRNGTEDIEVLKCLRLPLLTVPELLKLTKELDDINILSLIDAAPENKLQYRGQLVMDVNVCENLITQRLETKDSKKETISVTDIIKLETPSFINYIEMSLNSITDISYCINAGVDKSKLKRIVDCRSYKYRKNAPQFLYFDATVVQFIEIISKDKVINLNECLEYFTAMYKSNMPKIIDGIICPDYNVATKDKGAKVYLCDLLNMTVINTKSLESMINGDTDRSKIVYSHKIGRECFLIQLAQPYLLSSLRLLLRDNNYSYYIETSIDRKNWEMLIDKRNVQCKSWQNINFSSRKIVFFKIVGTAGVRNNDHNHYYYNDYHCFDCLYFECSSNDKYESNNSLNDNHKD